MKIHKSYLILPENQEECDLLHGIEQEIYDSKVFIGFKGCGGYGAFSLRKREDIGRVKDKLQKRSSKMVELIEDVELLTKK